MTEKFDFETALKAFTGKVGVLAPFVKQLTEAALEAELVSHLGEQCSVPCRGRIGAGGSGIHVGRDVSRSD